MPIVRKGKELLVTFRCKLGYHEWVAVHSYEYRQRPRRAIFSHNGWQTTSISNLDVEDLKRIRKVIRKAIRNHENNNNKRRYGI